MTFFAFILVLASAFLHAGWNFLAKRSGAGGITFLWSFNSIWVLALTPVAIAFLLRNQPQITTTGLIFIIGSGIVHIGYFWLLIQGYRAGDLSLIYPLARGTGPMLATIGAILLFTERPGIIALSGTILIGIGVLILAGDPRKLRRSNTAPGIMCALLTGITIAAYTLWDSYAVNRLGVPPLIHAWGFGLTIMLILLPVIIPQCSTVRSQWKTHRRAIAGVGILASLAYVLVLTAFTLLESPVSYIAPAREISILIGAFMGSRLLSEHESRRRLVATIIMLTGLIGLGIG